MNKQLLHCRVCGQALSVNADACPHCGEPNKRQSHSLAFNWRDPVHAVGGVLAIVILCGVLVLVGCVVFFAIRG